MQHIVKSPMRPTRTNLVNSPSVSLSELSVSYELPPSKPSCSNCGRETSLYTFTAKTCLEVLKNGTLSDDQVYIELVNLQTSASSSDFKSDHGQPPDGRFPGNRSPGSNSAIRSSKIKTNRNDVSLTYQRQRCVHNCSEMKRSLRKLRTIRSPSPYHQTSPGTPGSVVGRDQVSTRKPKILPTPPPPPSNPALPWSTPLTTVSQDGAALSESQETESTGLSVNLEESICLGLTDDCQETDSGLVKTEEKDEEKTKQAVCLYF